MLPFLGTRSKTTGDRTSEGAPDSAETELVTAGGGVQIPLSTVLEGLAAPTFVVDDGGKIREINQAALELFAVTRDAVDGTDGDEILAIENETEGVIAAALERAADVPPTEATLTVGETELVVEWSVQLLFDDDTLVGAVVVVRDVTDHVEQRRRTAVLEAYQQEVLDSLEADIQRLADGDLTVDPTVPEPDEEFEEIEAVYDAFVSTNDDIERVVENLRTVVDAMTDQSDGIAGTSDTLSASSEEVTASIEEIDASSTQLAAGAQQLATETDRADRNVDNLTASIEEITASAQQMASSSEESAALTGQGVEEIRTALGEIREATDSASQVATDISSLETSMQEVGDIVALISDIAEQTNILALNANIEAARAGTEGEGFAVVANEVKTLAERSQSAAKDIGGIIDQAQDKTDTLAESIREANGQVSSGADAVDDAADTVETIRDRIEDTNRSVSEITDAVESQAHSAEQVSAVVDDTAGMAQEISASIQQISASIDEQTQAMDQVTDQAQFLSATSDDMHGLVDLFKLAADESADMDRIADEDIDEMTTTATEAVAATEATEQRKVTVDGETVVESSADSKTDEDGPSTLGPDDF